MSQTLTKSNNLGSVDPVMLKLMHGKSSEERNAFLSMIKKDSEAHRAVTREYVSYWETSGSARDDEAARDDRKGKYMSLVNKSVRGSPCSFLCLLTLFQLL